MLTEENEKVAIEFIRQQKEAGKIITEVADTIYDMCKSRNVSYHCASDELMAVALTMLKAFHLDVYQGVVESHGREGLASFKDAFSGIAHKQFMNAGTRVPDLNNENDPATFGILAGDKLSNENLAQCLFLEDGVSISSQSDEGFRIGQEGAFFTIYVSVCADAVSFFNYQDFLSEEGGCAFTDCVRYNTQTNLSKAHPVMSHRDKPQIHFTYLYPHSGSVEIKNIKQLALRFIDECSTVGRNISWGDSY